MTEENQKPSVRIDPLKYLNQIPEFSGDYRDLQTFINLIDRVYPILTVYDEPSQLLFSDIIKSRLTGKAREVIEINCQVQSWTDIKTVLHNNFGDRCGLEELFDKLKGTTFKTNSVEFYNEIKQRLRSLNNKTIMTIGSGPAANECARNNMKTALNVFKEKIPEPMRTILTCRNPQTLEVAMEILFQAGYAYVTSTNEIFPSYGKPPNKIGHKNRQTYRQVGNNNSNNTKIFNNRNTQPHFSYNQPNPRNHYRNDIQSISNNWERRDYRNSNHNGQNQQQNNWNPFRQQDRQNIQRDNYFPRPEPMDVNNIETPTNRNHPQCENFRISASRNYHS
ncbi:hypothetical protein CVS40_11848 [Lucilia cuprina]|nr:hypothetical protein CVS40_11848 [Lucilia cuprina]